MMKSQDKSKPVECGGYIPPKLLQFKELGEPQKGAGKRIARRRADMPQAYRRTYDRALSGKSLRAATKAFCLECVQWEKKEVRLCPSVSCPLYPYRPYQETLPNAGPDDQDDLELMEGKSMTGREHE